MKIDTLTVQVAAVLWRLGGVASVREMAPLIAIAQGKAAGLTPEEQMAVEVALATNATNRASCGLAIIVEWCGAGKWALTETGHRILDVSSLSTAKQLVSLS